MRNFTKQEESQPLKGKHSLSGNPFMRLPIMQKMTLAAIKMKMYFIDSHSTEGHSFSPFNKMKGHFGQIGYRKYDFRPAPAKFAPFFTESESAEQRKRIGEAAALMKPGELCCIEAIDCIRSLEDARWLVGLKKERQLLLKVQLTYMHQNQLATGCWEKNFSTEGLSGLGKEVARTLMQGGIIIDVSHLNRQSTLDVCGIGREMKVPVIASHSNPLAVFARGKGAAELEGGTARAAARCIGDDEIRAILSTGGYVGITSYPSFISIENQKWLDEARAMDKANKPEEKGIVDGGELERRLTLCGDAGLKKESIARLVEHMSYVREIAKKAGLDGKKSVAFSTDVDSIRPGGPCFVPLGYTQKSYKHIFMDLVPALWKNGWKKEDMDALFHGNVERVFKA
ncbi:MAG: membrane dipeptidase [Candidatus Micrarchaeota archaeon]|nr:membrane dipeptidase [Candidatus Micrarchaeota archaeon]